MKEDPGFRAVPIVVAWLFAVSVARADEGGGALSFLRDHLEVGTRVFHTELENPSQHYIGSITGLEVEQDYAPVNFFADWYFTRYLGIGWTHEKPTFETDAGEGSDGDFELDTQVVYVTARYPNASRFTPYGAVGAAFVNSDFEPTTSWRSGADAKEFYTDDTTTIALALGCAARVKGNWSADFAVWYIPVDIETTYWLKLEGTRGPYDLSMDHFTFGLGVRYGF